ncbi:hypothetical protein P4O66_004637, partial [Electrophorus voltai]
MRQFSQNSNHPVQHVDTYTRLVQSISSWNCCCNYSNWIRSDVQIRCPYKSGYETHLKYLCRGECYTFQTKDIPVDSKTAKDERFSLNDDKAARVFTVTITDLRSEDGGKYWCATQQTLHDDYTEILLVVKVDTPMNVIVSHSAYTPPTPDPSTSVYTESTWSTGAHTVNGTNLQTNSPSLH